METCSFRLFEDCNENYSYCTADKWIAENQQRILEKKSYWYLI